MSEFNSYITVNSLGQEEPSIFDVIGQASLLENLHPAFVHIIKVFENKYPRHLSWIYEHVNEIYFCLHGILQLHYLSHYGASFNENFYGLKRIPIKAEKLSSDRKHSLTLPPKLLYKSLATLTLLPYIKYYLNKMHLQSPDMSASYRSQDEGIWKKFKSSLQRNFPIVHFSLEIISLYYYIRYTLGCHKVQSPLLHASGVVLACLSQDDYDYIEEKANRISVFSNIRTLRGFCDWIWGIVGISLYNTLEVGAFFLQFLDWFYSSDSTARNFSYTPIPPPPHNEVVSKEFANICPLCMQAPKQETALNVSGYVFCYACILPYVRTHGKCPVTSYPATAKQLTRIYKE